MKSAGFCAAAALCAAWIGSAQTELSPEFPDPASLASELRNLQRLVHDEDRKKLTARLPSFWHVRTLDGDFSISTAPLSAILDRPSSKTKRDMLIADAETWLDCLAAQLQTYTVAAPPLSNARADLESILARREFSGNGPPSAWDRFRERTAAAIENLIRRLFSFAREYPATSRTIFWLVVSGAVGLLGFWLFRVWDRPPLRLSLSGSPGPVALRLWEQWLEAARDAASQGDFRKAIQCAYWAGIGYLQASDALPRERSHTPREYVRLLSFRQQGQRAVPPLIGPLRTLTAHLERFWYGRAKAAPDDFAVCLGCLGALGCKVD